MIYGSIGEGHDFDFRRPLLHDKKARSRSQTIRAQYSPHQKQFLRVRGTLSVGLVGLGPIELIGGYDTRTRWRVN